MEVEEVASARPLNHEDVTEEVLLMQRLRRRNRSQQFLHGYRTDRRGRGRSKGIQVGERCLWAGWAP